MTLLSSSNFLNLLVIEFLFGNESITPLLNRNFGQYQCCTRVGSERVFPFAEDDTVLFINGLIQ